MPERQAGNGVDRRVAKSLASLAIPSFRPPNRGTDTVSGVVSGDESRAKGRSGYWLAESDDAGDEAVLFVAPVDIEELPVRVTDAVVSSITAILEVELTTGGAFSM